MDKEKVRTMKMFICFFGLIIFHPLLAISDTVPTPANDQFVNPVIFSTQISTKSKDKNDSLVDMELDPSGEAYVLAGKSSELIHLDSDGNTKSSVIIENVKSNPWWRLDKFIVDKNNNFYFLDKAKGKIFKYDKSFNFLSSYSVNPKGLYEYSPSLKIDPEGFLWLLQADCKITKFDSNLFPVQTIELKPDMGLDYPSVFHSWDFAFDSKGNVYIITFEDCIFKFDAGGKCLGWWGGHGFKTGQLSHPLAITCGPDDNVYVSDSFNHRIEKFSSSGEFITQWSADDNLIYSGLAVDNHGDPWVLAGRNVFKFNNILIEKDLNYFASANEKNDLAVPRPLWFTLNKKGEICEDFWKYSPSPPAFDASDFKMIEAPKSLLPLAEANLPIATIYHYDPIEEDSPNDEIVANTNLTVKEVENFKKEFKKLGELGFDLSEDNVGGEEDLERSQKTEWGYLWGFYNCLYFIPTNQPNKAFYIDSGMNHVDKMDMESFDNDSYLILVWCHGETGGEFLKIYDLDLANRKISSIDLDAGVTFDEASAVFQLLRLNNEEHYSLVDVQLFAHVKWPWIFSWNGKEWVNTSAKYPDFYKTQGVNIISNHMIGNTELELAEDEQKVMDALKDAALKGGPAAYIK